MRLNIWIEVSHKEKRDFRNPPNFNLKIRTVIDSHLDISKENRLTTSALFYFGKTISCSFVVYLNVLFIPDCYSFYLIQEIEDIKSRMFLFFDFLGMSTLRYRNRLDSYLSCRFETLLRKLTNF